MTDLEPPDVLEEDAGRRRFLKVTSAGIAAGALGLLISDKIFEVFGVTTTDLRAGSGTDRDWVMLIDLAKCDGCGKCTEGCTKEHFVPPGQEWIKVFKVKDELGAEYWLPRPCMQCENAPCLKVCPVGATFRRDDGVVFVDHDRCIGCRYCVVACPYGARTSDFGLDYSDGTPAPQPYEELPNHEYGKSWDRANHGSPVGNARKCQFCLHRLEEGMLPQCVTTCIGRATYFGDANDPDSLVSEKAREPNQIRLLEEHGTKPRVSYLV